MSKQELINGYKEIHAATPVKAYEAIVSFKKLTESLGYNFKAALKDCAKETGKQIESYALSHAIYTSNEGKNLAIDVLSTGVVNTKSTFFNSRAHNNEATLKFYAESLGAHNVIKALDQQELSLIGGIDLLDDVN